MAERVVRNKPAGNGEKEYVFSESVKRPGVEAGSVKKAHAVIDEVKKVITGKDECIEKIMAAVLAGGHVLLEDVPGVGKTEMALGFSRAMGLKANRIQFTPDVMPADITGFSMYQKDTGKFEYHEGAVMCNLLLADEINRTSPKTQSALLEVMEEGNVTVDGVTRPVPRPFIVLATQNPLGAAGTQRLPEAQMDRFLICTSMGYPSVEDEIMLLKKRHDARPMDQVVPVIGAQELLEMQKEAQQIFIHDRIYRYMVLLADATRNHPWLELGLSPRGTLSLGKMARAYAYLDGRNFVIPQDVKKSVEDVALHRIRVNQKARLNHRNAGDILKEIMEQVKEPGLSDK